MLPVDERRDRELAECALKGVTFHRLSLGTDGIAAVVDGQVLVNVYVKYRTGTVSGYFGVRKRDVRLMNIMKRHFWHLVESLKRTA